MKTSNTSLRILFGALGLLFSIVPPAAAILFYFPVWITKGGEYLISGIAVLLMILAFVPFFRLVRQILKSPSGYMIWLVIFLVFFFVSRISNEMITISFTGLVGNIIGAFFFKLSRRFAKNAE